MCERVERRKRIKLQNNGLQGDICVVKLLTTTITTTTMTRIRTVSSSKDKHFLPRLDIIGRMHVAGTGRSALDGRLIPPQSFATASNFENVHITGSQRTLTQPSAQNNNAAGNVFSSPFAISVVFALDVVVVVGSEGRRVTVATWWRNPCNRVCVPTIFVPATKTSSSTDSWVEPVAVAVVVPR